jgi:hypothetical protein
MKAAMRDKKIISRRWNFSPKMTAIVFFPNFESLTISRRLLTAKIAAEINPTPIPSVME